MNRYSYGDSALAAERLALIADVFGPASREFIARSSPASPHLAVDLGCGPGYTTSMLHEATGATRSVGLDLSGPYVDSAEARALPGVSFSVHDATAVPFPTGPADVLYSRLLLAHLAEPSEVCRAWFEQLSTGGVLLLDDLEEIRADDPAFRSYLHDIALEVVRRNGGALFVGPTLHEMPDPPSSERIHDDVAIVEPDPAVTARIFSLNLEVLVQRGAVDPRPGLKDSLAAIASGERVAAPVVWWMRQVAFRRLPDDAGIRSTTHSARPSA